MIQKSTKGGTPNEAVAPNLEKQIKRHIHSQPQQILIRTAPGLEELTLSEIKKCIFHADQNNRFTVNAKIENDGILVSDIGFREIPDLLAALTTCREALWIIKEQSARDMKSFERVISTVKWDLILDPGSSLSFRCDSIGSRLYHENMLIEVCGKIAKDAGFNLAPKETASNIIEVKLRENKLRVSISLLGEPGYIRGYKASFVSKASIRQDLAAGLISKCTNWLSDLAANYKPELIWVPFAGSGTLAFEAQIHFCGISPFLFGRNYAFNDFRCATPKSTQNLLEKLNARTISPIKTELVELDSEMTKSIEANIKSFVKFIPKSNGAYSTLNQDFLNAEIPFSKSTFIPLNPPYGKRLKEGSTSLYKDIGNKVARASGSVAGFVISPSLECSEAFLSELKGCKSQTSPLNQGGLKVQVTNFYKA